MPSELTTFLKVESRRRSQEPGVRRCWWSWVLWSQRQETRCCRGCAKLFLKICTTEVELSHLFLPCYLAGTVSWKQFPLEKMKALRGFHTLLGAHTNSRIKARMRIERWGCMTPFHACWGSTRSINMHLAPLVPWGLFSSVQYPSLINHS